MLHYIKKCLRGLLSKPYLSLQLEITSKCNLNCSHCYCPLKNANDLPLENWIVFLKDYKLALQKIRALPSFTIAGGEPLLSPVIFKICNFLIKEFDNPPIVILSNGTLITDKHLEYFTKNRSITFQISLDGPDEKTHDQIRGEGTFAKTLIGIQKLVSAKIPVDIQATLQKGNTTKIKDFFNLANSLSVNSMNFTRYIPKSSTDQRLLTSEELKFAYEAIVEQSKIYQIKTSTDKPLFCLIDDSVGTHGLWGFQGLTIDCTGNLKPSSRIDLKLGNLKDNNFFDLYWKHPIMKKLRSGEIQDCGQCKFYGKCGGDRNIAYALTGNILAKDDQCWLNRSFK